MREILAENLDLAIKELGIVAQKTYQGNLYQVWEMVDSEYEKLMFVPEEDWKDEYGMWRGSEGSIMGNNLMDFKVNDKSLVGWERHTDDEDEDFCQREYKTLLDYLCDEIGASTPKNVCALSVDLAKINHMSMGELFVTYQG